MADEDKIIKEPQPTEECLKGMIPLKLSISGTNSYYHHCAIYHGRSNYAVCLHTIAAVKNGEETLRTECAEAITRGTCPALHMRAQEELEGKALFYVDRVAQRAAIDANLAAAKDVVQYGKRKHASDTLKTTRATPEQLHDFAERTKSKEKAAPPVKKPREEIDTKLVGANVLGQAINNMMENIKNDE